MIPLARYRCHACGFEWEGYRVVWDPESGLGDMRRDNGGRGPTECPRPHCKSLYVDWLNWEDIRKALGRYWEREDA